MASIKQAAELTGVSTRTILRWEDAGKVSPERSEGGHRRFSDADMLVLQALARTPVAIDDVDYHRGVKKAQDAIAIVAAAKRFGYNKGYPEPTEKQQEFRRMLLRKVG